MTPAEPIEYESARAAAEANQQNAVAAIPAKLQAKEDQFAEKLRGSKVGPLKKLELLYGLVDELSGAFSFCTPCTKGCSACCRYPVSISEVEVAYIEKHTKHRRRKALLAKQDFHGEPCPFLQAGACSIYQARPFFCRRHHALTPNAYWCQPERSNDRLFSRLDFTGVNQAFDDIRLETQSVSFLDIRQYFGIGQ